MKEKVTIEYRDLVVPIVNEKGNIDYNKYRKLYLQDGNGKRISNDYFYIKSINDGKHYVVGDVMANQIENEFDNINASLKFGIISLQRNELGDMSETLVVPLIYDRILENNLNTVTAYANNNHLTYIDIDTNSKNYGKQLVPAILEHAVPFGIPYEGFAECSVLGVTGYLPRNSKPLNEISPKDLLTKEQVEFLLSYLDMKNNQLYDSSVLKFSKLSGNDKTLKLK